MNEYLDYLNDSPTVFFQCSNKENLPVEFVTTNVFELLNYTVDDLILGNITFSDLIYKDDKEQVIQELLLLAKSERSKHEFEPYRIVSKDNQVFWIQDITKIIRDSNNRITHYHCYITDITKQKKINEKLNESESIISTMYDNSFQFIGLLDPKGVLLKANKTSLEFANIEESDVVGKLFWDCPWWNFNIEEQQILQKDIKEAANGKFVHNQKIHLDKNGNKIYVDFSIKPVYNLNKEVIYLIPEGRNITEMVLNQKQKAQHLNIINENVIISATDTEGKIIKYSDKFKKLSGFDDEELIGYKHNIMKHLDNDPIIYTELWETITQGKVWKGEHRNVTKNGDVFWVENIITPNFNENNEIETYTSIYTDITSKKEIAELLIIDGLTNIYNRRHFNNVFKNELKRSKRHGYNFVFMIIDIDYFKQYNDNYGHQEGDIALVNVANCLKNTLNRAEDFVFRLGGEEFGIITSDITDKGILEFANLLRVNVENLHIKHEENTCSDYLTISIGVKNTAHTTYLDSEDIYKLADDALYFAKDSGRNRVVISSSKD